MEGRGTWEPLPPSEEVGNGGWVFLRGWLLVKEPYSSGQLPTCAYRGSINWACGLFKKKGKHKLIGMRIWDLLWGVVGGEDDQNASYQFSKNEILYLKMVIPRNFNCVA